MKEADDNYIYLTESDFVKYFSKVADDPEYRDGVSALKEGELYRLQTNNKIKNVLSRIARENHITVDKAFILLMQTSDMLNQERALLDKVTSLYKKGSALKKAGDFDAAKTCYQQTIDLCSGKSYLNQRKGGAYFHLALISKEMNDTLAYQTYLKLCLKFDPEHNLAKEYILNTYS